MRLIEGNKKSADFKVKGPETDTLVILIYGNTGLKHMAEGEKWGHKFKGPTDIGDVASCSYLIREYLKLNPDGRAFIYTAWPGIPAAAELRKEINQGRSREEKLKPTHEQMEPLRKAFDYPAGWLPEDYVADVPDGLQERLGKYMGALRKKLRETELIPQEALVPITLFDAATVETDMAAIGIGDKPASAQAIWDAVMAYKGRIDKTHSRPHMYKAMDMLIRSFPDLWKEGRLGMVPVGDVFLAVDKKMKLGEFPGVINVGEFSADGGHVRSGIPRYVLAATHYAVLFQDHPKNVDWKIFQDVGNYESKKFGFYVHQPDLGVHLDITPERAEMLNDTIWEVVSDHRYVRMANK
jgi:hypothetical protein